jgi:hypothetical protein
MRDMNVSARLSSVHRTLSGDRSSFSVTTSRVSYCNHIYVRYPYKVYSHGIQCMYTIFLYTQGLW